MGIRGAIVDLSSVNIGDSGAITLARSCSIDGVYLDSNNIGNEGVKALSANPYFKFLDLSNNNIDEDGICHLAQSKTLTELDLSGNNIRGGLDAFASCCNLKKLRLNRNRLGNEGVAGLANCTVEDLSINDCGVGDDGIRALIGNRAIKRIDISGNQIGNAGVTYLHAWKKKRSDEGVPIEILGLEKQTSGVQREDNLLKTLNITQNAYGKSVT